jgi:hypothetical protein
MSKKDYIEIARILREEIVQFPTAKAYRLPLARILSDRLCSYFLEDNPNFDPERFRAAVFGTEEAKK